MPPRIYKGIQYALNYPVPRARVYAAAWSFSADFPVFTLDIFSASSKIDVSFDKFGFECTSTSDSIDVVFAPFVPTFNGVSGGTVSFAVSMPQMSFLAGSDTNDLDATVLAVTASGLCYQVSNISVDVSALKVGADGTITGTVAIIPPDGTPVSEDDGAPILTGNTYIVVNLHTRSHTTYRDGNNIAVARTGELNFSSQNLKNLSDVYLNARVKGDMSLAIKSGEDTLRTYPVTFENTTQANLKNKKVRLAKGLRATTWKLYIISPEESHAEIRSAELVVNESKRRV
jgi:hypothetical protein